MFYELNYQIKIQTICEKFVENFYFYYFSWYEKLTILTKKGLIKHISAYSRSKIRKKVRI